jgi:hypothetical protein
MIRFFGSVRSPPRRLAFPVPSFSNPTAGRGAGNDPRNAKQKIDAETLRFIAALVALLDRGGVPAPFLVLPLSTVGESIVSPPSGRIYNAISDHHFCPLGRQK